MTYKELWIKQNPNKDFETAKCRDIEFNLTTNCGNKRCKKCWDEEVPESEVNNETKMYSMSHNLGH
jgi:hypothetical protein